METSKEDSRGSPTKTNIESPLRRALEQPPLKRFKIRRTEDAGTVTEPENLGPCEPGTCINLDGIVWNETKGGLLSLNITWRGKSFMGTLMDCSATEHGTEWAPPWVGNTEAPDKKPKVSGNKKKKNKKKRKKKKETQETHFNVSTVEHNDTHKEEREPCVEYKAPQPLINCNKNNCDKKFTSESALQYHVSFSHEKIIANKTVTTKDISQETTDLISEEDKELPPLNNKENKEEEVDEKVPSPSDSSLSKLNKIVECITEDDNNALTLVQNIEIEKPLKSPKNIIPIEPQQSEDIRSSPTISLSYSNLKHMSDNKFKEALPRKPPLYFPPLGNPQLKSVSNSEDEPTVIDLSKTCSGNVKKNSPRQQESNEMQRHSFLSKSFESQQNPSKMQRNTEIAYKMDNTNKRNANEIKQNFFLKIPNPLQNTPKVKTPSISIKTEFNTGHNKNLSDITDKPEILKHVTKSGTSGHIPPTSSKSSIFSTPLGYMTHNNLTPHSVVSGLMMQHLNRNPLMLPGLMNIPTAAEDSSSPFGSSLENLARVAEERTRNFGNFSPAHMPAAYSPAHIPAAYSPAHVPAGFSPAHVPAGFNPAHIAGAYSPAHVPSAHATSQRNCPPTTSDSQETPLLRHEHTHTHLHYITSPTHSQ